MVICRSVLMESGGDNVGFQKDEEPDCMVHFAYKLKYQ